MRIEVYKLAPENHPNSDKLVVQNVAEGKQVCLRAKDWEGVEYAAHIPPGAIVDITHPDFEWLPPTEGSLHRVSARTMGGVESYGFMTPAPEGSRPGDDVAVILRITF